MDMDSRSLGGSRDNHRSFLSNDTSLTFCSYLTLTSKLDIVVRERRPQNERC